MFQKLMLSVIGAGAIAATLLSSGVSQAGTTGAAGYPELNSARDCFTIVGAAVRNDCADTKFWLLSDYIQVTGNHTVIVNGFRPNSSSDFTCAVCPTTKEGGLVGCTIPVQLSTIGASNQLNLGTINVLAFGSLQIKCGVGPGARFNSASF